MATILVHVCLSGLDYGLTGKRRRKIAWMFSESDRSGVYLQYFEAHFMHVAYRQAVPIGASYGSSSALPGMIRLA